MSGAALAVRGLHRSYGGFEALAGSGTWRSARANASPMSVVTDPGKTTAVGLIAGLLTGAKGFVEVLGARRGTETPASIAARAAMAVVLDTPAAVCGSDRHTSISSSWPSLTASRTTSRSRIDAVLVRLGLDERRDSRPGELSRGMRQKVQLGCALIRPYRVLVLDEPVVGLDPGSRRCCVSCCSRPSATERR